MSKDIVAVSLFSGVLRVSLSQRLAIGLQMKFEKE